MRTRPWRISFLLVGLLLVVPALSSASMRAEILWRNTSTGQNAFWHMDGTTFLAGVLFPALTDQNWKIVGVGDFNADGKPDLVWRNTSTGQNAFWYMDGTTFLAGVLFPALTDQNWKIVGVGDFNADGKPDLVWRNTSTGQNAFWYMDGTTFLAGVLFPTLTDQNWKIVGVGDFNADGKPDLVWRNTSTGQNAFWYMDGTTLLAGALFPTLTDQNWKIVGVGDFNADGKPDLVWRNTSTGQNAFWYMDGTTLLSGALFPTLTDQNWKIVGTTARSGASSSKSYYISDSAGNDTNTAMQAQNPSTPWKSLSKVVGTAIEGDFVYLKRGDTWTNQTLAAGDDGITFQTYGTGAKPVVIGPGSNGRAFTSIPYARTVVDGIEFHNADAPVMEFTSTFQAADAPTVKNCKVVGTGTDATGIRVNSDNGYSISNVLIGGSGQGNEITATGVCVMLAPGTSDTLIDPVVSYNNIHDCGAAAIQSYGPGSVYISPYGMNISHNTITNITRQAIYIQGGLQDVPGHLNYIGYNTATNIGTLSTANINAFQLNWINRAIIEHNTIANVYTSLPDGDGIELDKAWTTSGANLSTNLTVRYNTVTGCKSGSSSQSAGISAVACTNSQIYYNICYDNHIGISHSTPYTSGNVFYNNVMDSNNYGALRGDYYEHIGPPVSIWKNNIFSNNAVYGFAMDQWSSGPTESYNLWYNNPANINRNVSGTISIDATDIVGNPEFRGPVDFHLLDGSPAMYAGTDVGVTSDLDGNPVPKNIGGRPSIGAYEP